LFSALQQPTKQTFFLQTLGKRDFDHIVVTGDISSADYLEDSLLALSEAAGHRSVFFVLGNHEFHGSSFSAVDNLVAQICRQRPNLHHLGQGEIIRLTYKSALIGQRGWADGKSGDGRNTIVRPKYPNYIEDFRGYSTEDVFSKMAFLGEASGDYFRKIIAEAFDQYEHLVVATHVPPFAKAVQHGNNPCSNQHLPYFANSSAGRPIQESLLKSPGRKISVLCGHTHTSTVYDDSPALRVHVADCKWLELLEID
jgi:Icc protein